MVLLPLVLVVLALVAFCVKLYTAAATVDAERAQLLAEVEAATGKVPVDASDLSRLMARLQKLPDRDSARDLLAAAARIELARDRAERAFALFGALASQPGATAAEQRLGSTILLRLHEAGGGDAAAAAGMLQQVLGFAETTYLDSQDPADLLRGWQAATRLSLGERATALAQRIVQAHADTPSGQLVQLARKFDAEFDAGLAREVENIAAAFVAPPVELEAMRVLVVLQGGAVDRAVVAAEAVLLRAPGVGAARWVAALVFHARMLGQPEGSAARAPWASRRNAQLDWLLERTPTADTRREQWAKLRTGR